MKTRQHDLEAVFWSKIRRGASYECWPWISAGFNEYGQFWIGDKLVGAHRYAWEITRKTKVPKGMMILHMCDYRACCNPNHLYCGDAAQNAKDTAERFPRPKKEKYQGRKRREIMYSHMPNKTFDYIKDKEDKDKLREVLTSPSYFGTQLSKEFENRL